MMRYVAMDIETSGLDPERCQVLELAAVVEMDWKTPVRHLPTFRALVNTGPITGEPTALAMNAELIREMAGAPKCDLDGAIIDLAGFLDLHFPDRHDRGRGVTIAGKNFGAFDYAFLRRAKAWELIRPKHRFIDVGNLWWNPRTDPCLPSLTECRVSAGVPFRPEHSAVEDCLSVVECVRARFGKGVQ